VCEEEEEEEEEEAAKDRRERITAQEECASHSVRSIRSDYLVFF